MLLRACVCAQVNIRPFLPPPPPHTHAHKPTPPPPFAHRLNGTQRGCEVKGGAALDSLEGSSSVQAPGWSCSSRMATQPPQKKSGNTAGEYLHCSLWTRSRRDDGLKLLSQTTNHSFSQTMLLPSQHQHQRRNNQPPTVQSWPDHLEEEEEGRSQPVQLKRPDVLIKRKDDERQRCDTRCVALTSTINPISIERITRKDCDLLLDSLKPTNYPGQFWKHHRHQLWSSAHWWNLSWFLDHLWQPYLCFWNKWNVLHLPANSLFFKFLRSKIDEKS